MVEDKEYQATPDLTLERQIMDSNVPKNEREWWARNEIERLREAVQGLLRVADGVPMSGIEAERLITAARSALQQKESE